MFRLNCSFDGEKIMETTASQVVIACLIFASMLTGGFVVLGAFVPSDTAAQTNYQMYNQTYSKFNDINTNTKSFSESIKDAQPSSGVLGIANGLLQTAYGALAQMWTSVSLLITMMDSLSMSVLHIPFWITGLIATIVLATVAFSLMAAWFHWRL